MNHYEKVLLDKIVDIRHEFELAGNDEQRDKCLCAIMLLIDCIYEFRDPPRPLDVTEGYGAMCEGDA